MEVDLSGTELYTKLRECRLFPENYVDGLFALGIGKIHGSTPTLWLVFTFEKGQCLAIQGMILNSKELKIEGLDITLAAHANLDTWQSIRKGCVEDLATLAGTKKVWVSGDFPFFSRYLEYLVDTIMSLDLWEYMPAIMEKVVSEQKKNQD